MSLEGSWSLHLGPSGSATGDKLGDDNLMIQDESSPTDHSGQPLFLGTRVGDDSQNDPVTHLVAFSQV